MRANTVEILEQGDITIIEESFLDGLEEIPDEEFSIEASDIPGGRSFPDAMDGTPNSDLARSHPDYEYNEKHKGITGSLTELELKNMSILWHVKKDSTDAYNDAAKGLSDKYGLDTSEIKAYVNAKEKDKLEQLRNKMESRQVLLDL